MSSISKETVIGMRTVVTNTISEYKKTGEVKSPNKLKFRPMINNKIDDFDKNAIHQQIQAFWFRREIPTLQNIIQAIKDGPDLLNIPRTSWQRYIDRGKF